MIRSLTAILTASTLLCGCSHRKNAPMAVAGAEHIQHYGCGSCHTIPGIPGADAHVGPPLTAIGDRSYIAGVLANNPQNLSFWVQHPHTVHPGTAMPEMGISPKDGDEIAAYLMTLR